MNARQSRVFHSLSIENTFYYKMELTLFYFHVTNREIITPTTKPNDKLF